MQLLEGLYLSQLK